MMKNKKLIAMIISFIMVISNFTGIFSNISFAVQENVTVVFSADSDDNIHLKEDGKTLNYTCSDNSSYDFQLVQNGVALTLTPNYNQNGNTYTATGISSNENLHIVSPFVNLGMVRVAYDGNPLPMTPEQGHEEGPFSSTSLDEVDDVNHYQFRIEEVHNGGNSGNHGDMSEREFTVDFRPASWTIEKGTQNETTTASVAGKDITNGTVTITGETEISLSNWHSDLMEAIVTVIDDGFSTRLNVSEDGKTKIMDAEAEHIPDGTLAFSVVLKEEHHDDQPQDMNELIYNVDFRPATWEIRNKTVTATVEGQNDLESSPVDIQGNAIITLDGFDGTLMEAVVTALEPNKEPNECFSTKLNVDEEGKTCIANIRSGVLPNDLPLMFHVQRRTSDGPEYNLPEPNTSANITVSGGNVCEIPYINARIAINGFGIWLDDPAQNPELGDEIPASITVNNFEYAYDTEHDNGKDVITFSAIFINKYIGKISINGTQYDIPIDYSNRTEWLNHYSHQEVGFDIQVDRAENYNIVVNMAPMEGEYQYIGNFLWTDDPAESESDLYIGNSTLEVVSVTYEFDGQEIYVEEQDLADDPHIEYDPYGVYGSLVVPEGATCMMRITPDYGYQVTSFGVNGGEIVTGDAISVFQFPIHRGNFHLMAQVTKVDDAVNARSEKVQAGTVEIGQNEIDSGTVVLSVDDIVPTGVKQEKFEEIAGDYTVNDYLEINLDQVFYKGTSENVWMGEHLSDLNEKATINLELAEDLDNKSIIVVHNIKDGEEFEVIEIESYDPDTNKITFKADSFSSYAIAIKDKPADPENPDNPTDPENPVDPENPDNPADPENPDNPNNPEEPEEPKAQEQYIVTSGNFVAIFSDDEGHEFELSVQELMNLTAEQLEAFDITEEEYKAAVEAITEALKEYGTILNVYEIHVDDEDEDYSHFGELTFKIKMTDEMKKYNSFKFICIDNETIKKEDIVDLDVEDGYLVGHLFHLSNYALVAKNIENTDNTSTNSSTTENTTDATKPTEEAKTNNPKTGDNIMIFVSMFIISIIGTAVVIKKRK